MTILRLLGFGGVVVLISGCRSWSISDVESLPPSASLPNVSEQGKVQLRYYYNIPGRKVADLLASAQYPNNPDEVIELTSLEVTENRGDNYGALARGYIVPPVSGDYTFFVSGDDETQLWLSTSSNQENSSLIASVTDWTSPHEYTKYSSQTSPVQALSKDKHYYFEVRLKEGAGGDHFSVAWQGPGISQQVIDGDYMYSWVKFPYIDDISTTEAYSLGYRVGFLDGKESLSFSPDFPPIDQDQDGIYDNWEIVHGLDPTNPEDALSDPDNDLIVAADEFLIASTEKNPDTDGDVIPDGIEYAAGLSPLDPNDAAEDLDGDGFINLEEYMAGTDLNDPEDMQKTGPIYTSGFIGQYFIGMNFDEFVTARQDPVIDFDWGTGQPMTSISQDGFSVRWSGEFTAPHDSGTRDYRFTLWTDDGTRLYLNDNRVIDDWSDHALESFNHVATLQPKEAVTVSMEFYENGGAATAQLSVTDLLSNETVSVESTVRIPGLNDSHSRDSDSDGIPDTWELSMA